MHCLEIWLLRLENHIYFYYLSISISPISSEFATYTDTQRSVIHINSFYFEIDSQVKL